MCELWRCINFKTLIVGMILFFSFIQTSFSEPIPITISPLMEEVLFDGKWSFPIEWKQTSLTMVQTDFGPIYIRSAHWENDIYVLVDVLTDFTPTNGDFAVLCINPEPDKNSTNFSKSFCFKTFLNSESFSVLKWDNDTKSFVDTHYHDNLIAMGKTSDENDRYDKRPHPTYEFKIPLDPIGRYDKYGFFVGVYDSDDFSTYTWPIEVQVDLSEGLPSPQEWGTIFSPDKSLPEYDLPMLILIMSIVMVIFVSSKISRLNLLFQNR